MLTIKLSPKKATLAEVRRKLNLSPEDLDENFGLVNIDPRKHLYTVLVEERAAQKVEGHTGVKGPFSNPLIEPFGPPTRVTAATTDLGKTDPPRKS